MRIGLIGCVKSKRDMVTAARDLYTSPLFVGRRRAVEETCDSWYILSAEHGLVHPEEKLAPYDSTLVGAARTRKREWSLRVLGQLTDEIGSLAGVTFSIHAGADYCDFGLVEGINDRGGLVERPVAGLRQGEQLSYYRRAAWRDV